MEVHPLEAICSMLLSFSLGSFTGACVRIAREKLTWNHWLGVIAYLGTLLWCAREFPEFAPLIYPLVGGFFLGALFRRAAPLAIMVIMSWFLSAFLSWFSEHGHAFYLVQAALLGGLLAWLGHLRQRPREQLALPLLLSPVLAQTLWQLVPGLSAATLGQVAAIGLGTLLGALDWLKLEKKLEFD